MKGLLRFMKHLRWPSTFLICSLAGTQLSTRFSISRLSRSPERNGCLSRGPAAAERVPSLLSLLAGVMTAQKGAVSVLGQRVDALSGAQRDRFRADHIGIIFQMFNLVLYLSLIENVTLPCRFSKRRRKRALRRSASVGAEAVRLLTHLNMVDPVM